MREILALMGCAVDRDPGGLTVHGPDRLAGLDLDLHDVGELTPVVAALCALASTPSTLRGVATSAATRPTGSRALADELTGLGGDVDETEDGLAIRPARLHGGVFHTYRDHRMAHAAAVLGLVVGGRARSRTSRPPRRRSPASPAPGRGWPAEAAPEWPDSGTSTSSPESFDRPRRHTRPRTKERPTYDDAVDGVVVTVDRGRYTCARRRRPRSRR